MESEKDIVYRIAGSRKRTCVKAYVRFAGGVSLTVADMPAARMVIIGEKDEVASQIEAHRDIIEDVIIETEFRNSAMSLLDVGELDARVEPGAYIRCGALIGRGAVVMMGAVINTGAVIGDETMVDMCSVIGGNAVVGSRCHIGAGSVIAGTVEPYSACPVVIGDDVFIGANAVVLEGCRVGDGAVVAAGAVVTKNVLPQTVVAGVPACKIKDLSDLAEEKRKIETALRRL